MKLVVYFFMILFALSVTEPLKIWAQEETEEKASNDTTKAGSEDKDKKKKKPKEPKFEDLIEDYVKTEGLFTIYSNEKEGKVYLEIRQDQFGPLYLVNLTRQSGDASLFDSGAMMNEFLFFIQMVGKNVQFIQKNVAFRADSEAAIKKALERSIPNSIWASAKIESQPHPEIGSILIDASNLFIQDYETYHRELSHCTQYYLCSSNSLLVCIRTC